MSQTPSLTIPQMCDCQKFLFLSFQFNIWPIQIHIHEFKRESVLKFWIFIDSLCTLISRVTIPVSSLHTGMSSFSWTSFRPQKDVWLWFGPKTSLFSYCCSLYSPHHYMFVYLHCSVHGFVLTHHNWWLCTISACYRSNCFISHYIQQPQHRIHIGPY